MAVGRKSVLICDGFEVTISRRMWDENNTSLLELFDKLAEVEESGMSATRKEIAIMRLNAEYREKVLATYVQNWETVKPRLSIAGFAQIEEELKKFSHSEVVEGN